MIGGQLALAMEPPTVEPSAKEGLINVRDFSIKGEVRWSGRLPADRSAPRTACVLGPARRIHPAERPALDPRRRGQGPDHRRHHRRLHRLCRQLGAHEGTFVPLYGLNNMFGQIPVLGLFVAAARGA